MGRFSAEVRCPECGRVIPSGTHVIIGAADAAAGIRERPLIARFGASFVHGRGCLAAIRIAFTLVLVPVAVVPVIGVVTGSRSGLQTHHWVLGAAAGFFAFATARDLWLRRRLASAHGLRANQVEHTMIIAPGHIEFDGKVLAAETVLAIRVEEHTRAGSDEIVAAIEIDAPDVKPDPYSVFVPIPEGGAEALAAMLTETLRRKIGTPPQEVPAAFTGSSPPSARLPLGNAMGMVVAVLVPFVVFVPLLSFPEHIRWSFPLVLVLLIIAVLFSIRGRPVWKITPEGLAIASVTAFTRAREHYGLEPRPWTRVVPRDTIAAIELRRTRGVPVLRVVRRGWLKRSHGICPDDWRGHPPAEFGRAFAARLGVPFREVG
jgi:hypothetical protein